MYVCMHVEMNLFIAIIFVTTLGLSANAAPNRLEDEIWSEFRRKIDNYDKIQSMAVIIGDDRGELFVHEKGWYTRDTATRIWSSSKWISAMAIMRLVERGIMNLDDKPSKYLPYWTTDPNAWQSAITLHHLLSFTSGYGHPVARCTVNTEYNLTQCVREVYDIYQEPTNYPGTKFVYGDQHLHIAGLMAVIASGRESFQQLIDEEIVKPNNIGQPFRFWNERSSTPAAGLFTTPTWYARVLEAYMAGRIVKPETAAWMETDHTPYPISDHIIRYGYAHWIICEMADPTAPCSSERIHQSGGWQGYFPVIDRKLKYWAVFANVGEFDNSDASELYTKTRAIIRKAVEISRHAAKPAVPKDDNQISSQLRALGSSVVAIMKNLVRHPGGSFIPKYRGKYRDMGVCKNQPYLEQPTIASCSGFLVSPSQIATSGECIKDMDECRSSFFVFDYALDDKGSARTLFRSDQVYTCLGYATDARGNVIVTLDKLVTSRNPLQIAASAIETGESVMVIGHPNGLPRKYVESGNARTSEDDAFASFYITDTNLFGDFTGSPIFRKGDDKVVGVFKTKSNGLTLNLEANCLVSQSCVTHFGYDDCKSNTAADATSISAYLNIRCKSDSDCNFSGKCTAGQCQCSNGFFGRDCSYAAGFEVCNMQGIFLGFNQCMCPPGRGGNYCETSALPPPSITPAPQDTYSFGFGYSVSADGPLVAVGQPFCAPAQTCDGGIVSIYYDIGGYLYQIGHISNPQESADARCGQKVVIRGEYVFVSCAASTAEPGKSSAAILIFHYANESWNYVKTVLPPSWDSIEPVDGLFGVSVDVLDSFMAAGAPQAYNDDGVKTGAAYFYLMTPDSDWEQYPFKMTPADGKDGDNFGANVAISQNVYYVEQVNWTRAHPEDMDYSYIPISDQHVAISNNPASQKPSVYVYSLNSDGFHLKSIVSGFGSKQFATALALTPTSLIVGDPGFAFAGVQSGVVFVFDLRGASQVTLAQTLTPNEAHDGQYFGSRVAAYDDHMVAFEGETADKPSPTRGFTVFKSRPNKVSYSASRRVASNYLPAGSAFGADVAFSSSGIIVGAPLAEGDYPGRGAVVLVP